VTCDDGVALVVEGTAEDLVRVSLQDLLTLAVLGIPQSRGLVRARGQHARALGVERNLKRRIWQVSQHWQ